MTPKVTFVIPVYDGDAYLAETIDSIRAQTLKDIEVWVVDDSSPDFTQDLMEWYTLTDARIKYHKFETNQGVCAARNYGNEHASGDIICVCDQDDLCDPDRAQYSYDYLTEHPEIDCLTSNYWECNVSGFPVKKWEAPQMTKELFEKGEFVWMHSSAAYRKQTVLELPYRKMEGATDDWVFLQDWLNAGKKFFTTDKVLANCRRLPWGVMQQRRAMMGAEASYIL